MPIPVTIPRLGWNMDEGTFVEWLKVDGDLVRPGDAMFRLEGEKATEEIESLDAGTLHIPATCPKPGDRVKVGTLIGYLLQPGELVPEIRRAGDVQQETGVRRQETRKQSDSLSPVPCLLTPAISPRARRLAIELG